MTRAITARVCIITPRSSPNDHEFDSSTTLFYLRLEHILRTGTICHQINQTEDTMKTASGLEYIEVEAGTGAQAEAGKTVSVHYTGKFQDGKVFDSSVPRGEPIAFPLGAGRVIKGWDEGIALMKVGGKAQLVIPPHLAYGERGAGGVIPPNATLVFDVELVAVE
jgi:peptidylprolyl isomerase